MTGTRGGIANKEEREELTAAIVARAGGGRIIRTLTITCGWNGCDWTTEGLTEAVMADRNAHRLTAHGSLTPPRKPVRVGQPVVKPRTDFKALRRKMVLEELTDLEEVTE